MTWRQRYGNKYGAKRQEYGGFQYHSKKEAGHAAELDLMQKAGLIKSWRRQERIDLSVNGYHICNYYVDFTVTHNDDSIEYVEVKGFVTDVFRIKWRLFEAISSNWPNVKLTVIR